jgi:DNA helicase II / ATP-dependent DNA helicase PcrA
MTKIDILTSLNDVQQKAVTTDKQHVLVLAGAGSGKTRVLTHRIAWLIQQKMVSPFAILAVTFTNKAATEMRSRIAELIGAQSHTMWLGTFHGLAHRLLRLHYQEAGLSQTFQIIDQTDQQHLLRQIIKDLGIDEKQWPAKQVQAYINRKKDEGVRLENIETNTWSSFADKMMNRIYEAYEKSCQQNSLVDFAELLLRSYELFRNNPSLLTHYQQLFRYLLIDEFQDTNDIQYAWISALCHNENSLTIVGDDDQSIYGWRGAKIENIHRFQHDFPQAEIVRLEQNYRSTQPILNAANSVISHNDIRLGKKLWTAEKEGEPITIYHAYNDKDEAQFVVNQIQNGHQQGYKYSECAVLYRSNAQSRILEEILIREGVPYRIYGGFKFFERAEIKDALGYLRLIVHHDDDAAFLRVLNMPARGLGDQTLAKLKEVALARHCSLWQASLYILQGNLLTSRVQQALLDFMNLVEAMALKSQSLPLSEQTSQVLEQSGLMAYYANEKDSTSCFKIENLKELISATEQFEKEGRTTEEGPTLQDFLSFAVLESVEDPNLDSADSVQLMTLHAAKGLEFPMVFMVGMEEGLFPHQLSMETPAELEEERRLCYVGITRTMHKLYLSYADVRRLYGHETFQRPSRFLDELPSENIEKTGVNISVHYPYRGHQERTDYFDQRTSSPSHFSQGKNQHISSASVLEDIEEGSEVATGSGDVVSDYSSYTPDYVSFQLGQLVKHTKFGEGTVVGIEGEGKQMRVQVNFKRFGVKWLNAEIAFGKDKG